VFVLRVIEIALAFAIAGGVTLTIVYPFAVTTVPGGLGHSSYIPVFLVAILGGETAAATGASIAMALAAVICLVLAALTWLISAILLVARRPAKAWLVGATVLTILAFAVGLALTNVWRGVASWITEALAPTGTVEALNFDILAFMLFVFASAAAALLALHWGRPAPDEDPDAPSSAGWRFHLTVVVACQSLAANVGAVVGASLPVVGGSRSGWTALGLAGPWLTSGGGLASVWAWVSITALLALGVLVAVTLWRVVQSGAAPGWALATGLVALIGQGAVILFLRQLGDDPAPVGSASAVVGAYGESLPFLVTSLITGVALIVVAVVTRVRPAPADAAV
jgi:hypothetical protein